MIELINFINLEYDEKVMILNWRNHPKIKSVMHNNLDILLDDHLNFIESLKKRDDKKYFLVKENSLNIGVIDFINITKYEAELGIYSNPDLRGYGTLLLSEICTYAFETLKVQVLKAEVYKTNVTAIQLYQKFNFKEIQSKNKENKEIIYMELKNENW
ncbi:UDP-4-amino-4,6-dideoxy-N-acetyl-beta-L-altrosami ne N-acetyltransferase [Arcobacter sp. 15-2]|uniref:UDP-4-amino-4, 6-dideoxy-N-acetyl-beta-L-altrosamine N-acetyltransferase n=1 Tax=Arcobacter sp. 15-2 TaxID=3374109 RepID=UPI00399CE607